MSDSEKSSSSSDDDIRAKKKRKKSSHKSDKKDDKKKRERKKKKKSKKSSKKDLEAVNGRDMSWKDASEAELDEARELWGKKFRLSSSQVSKAHPGLGAESGAIAKKTGPGNKTSSMEGLAAPRETGRAGKVQSTREKRVLNMAYAANEERGGVGVVSDALLYGGDDNPHDRRRAAAAASNARVQAMVEAARLKRQAGGGSAN